jgi:lipopolysaccharide biosynthesis regulator YciM
MEFDVTWILLGLPVAFALGWFASRLDVRQLRIENKDDPKAYFKGLNFLLNEQQDQAIDAFVQAVQDDPDTSELHFALGNLFRRRGEYDRAVRVHAHLVARADLSKADHERALHALSLDYLRAGLLDRAEAALRDLEGTVYEGQARRTRLTIYERSRDWDAAQKLALQIEQADGVDLHKRRAHHWCELAAQSRDTQVQERCLNEALNTGAQSSRARIAMAQWLEQRGDRNGALEQLLTLESVDVESLLLASQKLAELGMATGRTESVREVLRSLYDRTRGLDALEGLAMLADSPDSARDTYLGHLRQQPSLVVAARWIEGEKFEHEEFHPEVQKALDAAVRPLRRYRCGSCGFEAQQYFWQCPGCQSWDSYAYKRVEEL